MAFQFLSHSLAEFQMEQLIWKKCPDGTLHNVPPALTFSYQMWNYRQGGLLPPSNLVVQDWYPKMRRPPPPHTPTHLLINSRLQWGCLSERTLAGPQMPLNLRNLRIPSAPLTDRQFGKCTTSSPEFETAPSLFEPPWTFLGLIWHWWHIILDCI